MDDLFGLIVIIIGIAAGIYSDKKKKRKTKESGCAESARRRKKKCTTDTGFLWWSCRKTGCSGGCGKCDAEGFICKTAGIKTEAAAEVWHGCIEYGKATQAARPVSNPGKGAILNRADSNVNENQTDELREQFYEKQGSRRKKYTGSVRTNVPDGSGQ